MNSASKDIATLLDGQTSLGLSLPVTGTPGNLFYSRMPDKPDDCVAIIDNPGDVPMLALKKLSSNYHYSSVSIQVRNTDHDTGWGIINAIWQFLHGHSNETIASTYYALFRAMADPQVLAYDDNERVIFMVNFEVQRRSS